MLKAELDQELGYEKSQRTQGKRENMRNGHNLKTVRSELDNIELEVPRDRNSEFEPQAVKKNSRDISGIEDIVISMYARGMSKRDIHDQIQSIMVLMSQQKW